MRDIPTDMVNPGKAQACKTGISNIPIEVINSRIEEVGETGRGNIILDETHTRRGKWRQKKENVAGSNSILQLTVKLGTDNEGKKKMKSEEGIDSTENGGVRRELVITKSLDCPEGMEILPGKTIDGESLFSINTTNKEMTVKAAGVLGPHC